MKASASDAWSIAIDMWITYLCSAGRSPGTIRLRRYYVERFAAAFVVGPFDLTMDQLVVWLANPDWGQESRKSARASLCSFYGWAVDSDRITDRCNPARKLAAVTPVRARPRPTPDTVLQQALWFADDKQELMLLLAGYGGLRRSEVARVHPEDFDWDREELLVRGKGGHERLVPVHPDLARAVRAELGRRAAGQVGTGFRLYAADVTPGSYLFPGKAGHVTPDTVGRVLDRLLAGKWTGHTLRHRFATAAYAAERDLRAVQELLGHAKPETTAIYVEEPPEAKRAAVWAVSVRAA